MKLMSRAALFLTPTPLDTTYVFPEVQDALQDATDVLVPLSPTAVSGRTYFLSVEETKAVATALQLRKV